MANTETTLWAETDTTGKQLAIARDWARRFSYKQLRAFQAHYAEMSAKHQGDDMVYASFDNRWSVATLAIDIQAFCAHRIIADSLRFANLNSAGRQESHKFCSSSPRGFIT